MKARKIFVASAALALTDQLLKTFAEQKLERGEQRKIFQKIFLRRVENRGMSMNVLSDRPAAVKWISIAVTAAVSLAQLFTVLLKKGSFSKYGVSLMASGAWSNTFDRIFRGYVVDYIGFDFQNKKISAVTYNLGDFFIAAGAGMTILPVLKKDKPENKLRKKTK